MRRKLNSAVGIIVTGILASAALAQSTYVLEPLGDVPEGGFLSRAFAINNNGWIVGASKITDGDDPRQAAVRWLPGMTEPELLSGAADFDFSRAMVLNNENQIGGYAEILDPFEPPKAFLHHDDTGFDFFVGEDNNPDLRGSRMGRLTNFGKVVGWVLPSELSFGNRGYVYDIGTEDLTILNPVPPNGNLALAHGINSSGLIVGTASDEPDKNGFRRAVRWPVGSTDAEFLPGFDNINARFDDVSAAWVGEDGIVRGMPETVMRTASSLPKTFRGCGIRTRKRFAFSAHRTAWIG